MISETTRQTIYPPHFTLQPQLVAVLGHRIAYFDEGQGSKPILLLHGNPVSAYVYARLIQRLVPEYRCIAPDLLGFGLSDKPTREAYYSLPRHIAIITEFVRALDLQDTALVVHDWGGPIGLGAAVQEKERYTHLIILNTLTEPVMRISPVYKLPFHILARTPRLAAYFIRQKGLFQKMGVAVMDEVDQQVYFRANPTPETRAGIAAFPKMIPYHANHPTTPVWRDILAQVEAWDIPALVMFSDHDSVFRAEEGERLAQRLANARFKRIAGPKHFLQYQAPDELAAEIKLFLRESNL